MDFIEEYITLIYSEANKQTKVNRRNDLKKLVKIYSGKTGTYPMDYLHFKVWKNYKNIEYEPCLKKHNLNPDNVMPVHKRRMIYNPDAECSNDYYLILYLKLMTQNKNLEDESVKHYINSRKNLLKKQIKEGKTNKFIKNFMEYYRMKYIVEDC